MPSSAKEKIIDLTDIVEEGHPERPNIRTASKPSPATEDVLDDLDLEKEIDQIFADLSPPEKEGQGAATGRKGKVDADTLDLDALFQDQDGSAPESSGLTEVAGVGDDSTLDFAQDFDRLFGEETSQAHVLKARPGAPAAGPAQPADEPDWLAELDGLGLDEFRADAPVEATDLSAGIAADRPTKPLEDMEAALELDLGAEFESALDSKLAPEPEPVRDTARETPLVQTEEVPDIVSLAPEETVHEKSAPSPASEAQDVPAPIQRSMDEEASPGQAAREAPVQASLPESVLQRIQELEDRLAALENREQPQVVLPEPDLDGLLAQVDERVAASPALADLGASQSEALQALTSRMTTLEKNAPPQLDMDGLLAQVDERVAASPALADLGASQSEALQALTSRLSAIEQQEPPQLDMDGLLAQVDQRIDERVGARVDSVQQLLGGMTEQVESTAARIVDAEMVRVSESMSADVEKRLRERLEERLEESLQGRMEELKAFIREDIEQKFAVLRDDFQHDGDGQPEDPRMTELAANLEALGERIEELTRSRIADTARVESLEEAAASMLQEREEQLEARLLETFRHDLGSMREDWDGQKNVLAKDLENSLNYWAKLQDKFKELQGEWQTLRREQEEPRTGVRKADVAGFSEGWRDELAAQLNQRLEVLRGGLLQELTDEMDKAVPLAAARIIREEIQAMVQEEDIEQ